MIFPPVKAESHFNTWISGLTCKRNLSLEFTAWKWASPLIRFMLKSTTCQINLRIKSHICAIVWIAYWFRFFKIVSSAKSEGQQNQSFQPKWFIPWLHAVTNRREGYLHQHKAAHCHSLYALPISLRRGKSMLPLFAQHFLKYS